MNGQCVDYVNVHDGSSVSASTLNADRLCAEDAEGNFTSTGNTMTVYFETDSTGARHGFDFIFVAITTGKSVWGVCLFVVLYFVCVFLFYGGVCFVFVCLFL